MSHITVLNLIFELEAYEAGKAAALSALPEGAACVEREPETISAKPDHEDGPRPERVYQSLELDRELTDDEKGALNGQLATIAGLVSYSYGSVELTA